MLRFAAVTLLLAFAPLTSHAGSVPPGSWPGAPWVTAKAYTYAWHPGGPPKESLRIYEPPRGLHSEVRSEAPLTRAQGEEAIALVRRTEGPMEVSKCPFPRHGVVFFDASGQAVGSVSVCFECGDILVWPDTGKPSRRKAGRDGVYKDAFMKRYDDAMTRWRAWFAALPDMPPDWAGGAKPPPGGAP